MYIMTKKLIASWCIIIIVILGFSSYGQKSQGVKKIKDLIIYKDAQFFSSFASVIKNEDGEIIVAFRRAPDRKIFKEKGTGHVDPNSYLVFVRSRDNGL